MKFSFMALSLIAVYLISSVPTLAQSGRTDLLLVEGVGLGGIMIGRSTLADVVAEFGKDFERKERKNYSIEYSYPKPGLSFWACTADPDLEVFVIEARKLQAITPTGIRVGKSTRNDVAKAYENGIPDGIEFSYGKRDVVSEINILETEGVRQCDSKFRTVKDK